MWGKSTKQRRAARARRWTQRRLFRFTSSGELGIPALYFIAGDCPFTPARLFGWGWRASLSCHAMVMNPRPVDRGLYKLWKEQHRA